MRFDSTPIPGAWLIDLEPRTDERGFFARVWCEVEFAEHGIVEPFVQTNLSYNQRAGTLRGLHYQKPPHGEAKLMRCIAGAIYDVIVDVRPSSPAFGRWFGVELSAANRRMLYVPAGCAHGYQALSDGAETLYSVSAHYARGAESGIRWNDPTFGIVWPIPEAILSPKDTTWPDFAGLNLSLSSTPGEIHP